MAFSFKNALANVAKSVSNFIAPKKPAPVAVKPPSSNFINNSIAPAKTLLAPKITTPTPKPLTSVGQALSSVNNQFTNKSSNPLNNNVSTITSNSNSVNPAMKSAGQTISNLGTWIDQNVRSGSGNILGEGINAIGKFGGYFKDGGSTAPMGRYSPVPTPKFDFSAALQNLGNKLVKKAGAYEGTGTASNTPTGSYLPGALSSGPSSSMIKPTAPKPEAYPIGSMGDGRVKMSDGTIRNDSNGIFDSAKGNYDKFSTEQAPALDSGEGAYVALNDQVSNIMSEYEQGNMSAEDAQSRMAEAQRKYLEAQYNTNEANANALIPEYEQFRDKAVGDINTNLAEVKANATKTKETTSNTYGDILRRATENKRYTDAQRRNQFSALGTADSSAFIESQQRADSTAGSDNSTTERELANKLSGIDTEVSKAEKSAFDQATSIKTDAQNKIEAVKRSINLSREEKAAKLEQINAQLYSDITGLAQDLQDKKAALLTTQLTLSGNLQAIKEQGNVDLNTQQQAFNLQNPSGNTVPADLQQELSGYVGQASSSYAKRLKAQQLISAYPAYTDYINQIMNPAG